MAKVKCEKCGKEVGFVSQVKLCDGVFICKECYKEAGSIFNNMDHGYATYEKLIEQQKQDKNVFEEVIKKNKIKKTKTAVSGSGNLYMRCYEDVGLIVFVREKGGFMGIGTKRTYNVYRYADLARYEFASGRTMLNHSAGDAKQYIEFTFQGDYAVPTIYFEEEEKEFRKLATYFNDCFGIASAELSSFRGFKERGKQQFAAASSAMKGLKSLANGEKEAAAGHLVDTLTAAIQGDRTKWIEKTNMALQRAGIEWNR